MFFNVESWRQIGAAAGFTGVCLFCKKKKNGSKKRQKRKIFGILKV